MSAQHDAQAFYRGILGSEAHLPEELLLRLVQNKVNALEKSRIEAHLMACGRCRGDVEALLRLARPSVAPAAEAAPVASAPVSSAPVAPAPVAPAPVAPAPATPPVVRRPALPVLPLAVAFLAINALGLGLIYRKTNTAAPPPAASPAPTSAPSPGASEDLTRFRAAYEAQLSLERGRVAQLEKQVAALKLLAKPATASASPAPNVQESVSVKPLSLSLPPLRKRAVSLSARPSITWKPVPKAVSYAVELLGATGKPLERASVRATGWKTTKALKRGSTYRWRVTALSKTKKPLGTVQQGGVTVMAKGEAGRLMRLFTQLGDELERLGYRREAATARERATSLR